ncbi:MAG: TrkH family potassium uptake protein [Candidatus Spyradocola sp.]|jgi:trk system potassium uptake protein TrkH
MRRIGFRTWVQAITAPQSLARLKVKKAITSPSRVLMLGFGALIFLGALILHLPLSSTGERLSFLDALFTATSAVCVTGLSVINPGSDLTFFGQAALIVLIQVGGLGFMTLSTLILILLRRRITLSERLVISNSLNEEGLQGMVALTMRIVALVFGAEGIGAVLLMTRMIPQHGVANGVWLSVFHSISAFCNAGFDLVGGFSYYKNDPVVQLIICALITVGGLGFSVLFDLQRNHMRFARLTLHSKLVLVISAILTLGGAVCFLVLEMENPKTLADPEMHVYMRPINALFQSVTSRTAGFNTINQGDLTAPSLMLTMILMFIGASPASTGGGLKTTTFGLFFLLIYNVLRGRERVVVFRRTVNQGQMNRAVVLFTLALSLIIVSYVALTLLLPPSEAVNSSNIMYEVISAFGTVGLSIGVTAELNAAGKVLMCIVMFVGRVGLLTIALGITRRHPKGQNHLIYPQGKVMIG